MISVAVLNDQDLAVAFEGPSEFDLAIVGRHHYGAGPGDQGQALAGNPEFVGLAVAERKGTARGVDHGAAGLVEGPEGLGPARVSSERWRRSDRFWADSGVGPRDCRDLGLTVGIIGFALGVQSQDQVVQVARLGREFLQPLLGVLGSLNRLIAQSGLAADQAVEALLVLVQSVPLQRNRQLLAFDLLAEVMEIAEL